MRNQTDSIDEKIKHLQNKKKALEIKQALSFVRTLEKVFNEEPDLQAILGLVKSQWSQSSSAKKEEWKNKAPAFCKQKF